MKKLLIILALFIAVVATVAYFVSRNAKTAGSPPTTPAPTAGTTLVPKPTFPDVSAFLPQPAYSIGALSGSFPSSVPVYTVQAGGDNQTEISRLATIFHINTEPTVVSALDGTYHMWSTDPGLIVGPNGQHVDYSETITSGSSLSEPDNAFVSLGQQLASSVLKWYPVQLTSTQYFAPKLTDLNFVPRENAVAIQIGFLPTLSGLPIIAGDPKLSETVIRYSSEKALVYYSGYIYPRFVQTTSTTPIVSLQAAAARLVAGEGSILSASSPSDINAHDTRLYQFSLSTITGARLAYYYNFGTKQLSPVFLFTGTATDRTTQKQVETVSAVAATP